MRKFPHTNAERRSRTTPTRSSRIHLTERDEVLLCDVFLQRVITRKQLNALGYFGSTTVGNTRLRALFDAGYLRRTFAATGGYATEALYLLGSAAIDVVSARLGVERSEVARIIRTESPAFTEHCRAISEVRIAFQKGVPEGVTVEWLAECQVRHEYSVRSEKGISHHILKPDGAVLFQSCQGCHLAFLEIERGHTGAGAWRRSVAGYRRYLDRGFHREMYGVETAEILCVSTAGHRRIDHLAGIANSEKAPFRFASFDVLVQFGPFPAIWTDGVSEERTSLLSEVLR